MTISVLANANATLPRRFWAKVRKTDTCWLWTGAKSDDGYGNISAGRKVHLQAHRVAYELLVGPIPDGLHIDHLCRTPLCVRPEHMEPVPPAVNNARGFSPSALNRRKEHCLRGHDLVGANLRLGTDGARVCVECSRMRQRDWHASRRTPGPGAGWRERARTHCPQGHPYDEGNTYVDPRGKRQCRECGRARCRARRSAQSGAAA